MKPKDERNWVILAMEMMEMQKEIKDEWVVLAKVCL